MSLELARKIMDANKEKSLFAQPAQRVSASVRPPPPVSVYDSASFMSPVPKSVSKKNGISTFTLPDGRQFRLDSRGEPVISERKLTTKQKKEVRGGTFAETTKEVDHKVSLGLGGTNVSSNLQSLQSTKTISQKVFDFVSGKDSEIGDYKPENRQEGKMIVEQKAIKKYRKGEIGLFEAMAAVQHYDNKEMVADFLHEEKSKPSIFERITESPAIQKAKDFITEKARQKVLNDTLKLMQNNPKRFRDKEDGVAMIHGISEQIDQWHDTTEKELGTGAITGAIKLFSPAHIPLTKTEMVETLTLPIRFTAGSLARWAVSVGLEQTGTDAKFSPGSYNQQLIMGKEDFERLSTSGDLYGEAFRLSEKMNIKSGLSADRAHTEAISTVMLLGLALENPFFQSGKAVAKEMIEVGLRKGLEKELSSELGEGVLKLIGQEADRISKLPIEQRADVMGEFVERMKERPRETLVQQAVAEGKTVKFYHGSNKALTKDDLDYGTFLTTSKEEALDYAKMRSSGRGRKPVVSEFTLSSDEVRLNTGTGEHQYIGKTKSLSGGKYPEKIYKTFNDVEGSNLTRKEIDTVPLDEVRSRTSMGLEGGRDEFDQLVGKTFEEETLRTDKTTIAPDFSVGVPAEKITETLASIEKQIEKRRESFRKEAGLMAQREGAGVVLVEEKDARGFTVDAHVKFKLNKAKAVMRDTAESGKKYANEYLYENDATYRALVDDKDKILERQFLDPNVKEKLDNTAPWDALDGEIETLQNNLIQYGKEPITLERSTFEAITGATRKGQEPIEEGARAIRAEQSAFLKDIQTKIKQGMEKKSRLFDIQQKKEAAISKAIGKTQAKAARQIGKIEETMEHTVRGQEIKDFRKLIKERFSYEKELDTVKATGRRAVELLKNKAIDLAERKKELSSFASSNLSPQVRGKLLQAVASAKTDGDFARAVRRVQNLRNDEIKKELIADIKDITTKAENLGPNDKERLLSLIKGFDFKKLSEEKKEELLALQDFLTTEAEAIFRFGGKSLKKAEAIERLSQTPIKESGVRDLIALRDRMEFLLEQGEVKKRISVGLQSELAVLRRDLALDEIAKGSRNMDKGLPPPRDPLAPDAKFSDFPKENMRNAIRSGTQDYSSPDVGFQILDDEVERGTNWRTFKAPIDEAVEGKNEMRNGIVNDLFDAIADIEKRHGKLQPENYRRVMLWATTHQTGGREKLLKSNIPNLTEKILDDLKLTEGEQKFYALGRSIFDQLRPEIDRVKRAVDGEALGQVENYWSWMTDFENSDEVGQRLTVDFTLSSRTTQGFTKSRALSGRQTINLDALDVLVKHIDDATYYIHTEELIRNLGLLARSSKYKKAVGEFGQKWVLRWIDLQARAGIPKGYKPGPLTKLVRRVGHGILGFKISPIVKQPLAKITSASLLGKDAFLYDAQFFTTSGLRDAVHKASRQQRFRSFDDPVFTEMAKNKKLAWWQQKGYAGMKAFDSATSDSVWYAAYRKYHNTKGISFNTEQFINGIVNKDAAQWADLIARRTQGSAEAKDTPLFLARESGRDVVMAFLQFQRFSMNQSLLWRDAKVALMKEKNPVKAAGIASALLAAGLAESYVTTGLAQVLGSKDFAEEERAKSKLGRVIDATINQLPIISNIVSISEFGSSGVSAIDVAAQGFKGVKTAFTADEPIKRARGASRALSSTLAAVGVSGASQADQIARKVIDSIETRDETLIETTAEHLESIPNEQAAKEYDAFLVDHPELEEKLSKAVDDLQSGITKEEKEIRALGVENKERAQRVKKELDKLKTPEQKAALWDDYLKKKIITKEVEKQIDEME